MLARVLCADPHAVMRDHVVIERADIAELPRQGRRLFGDAGCKLAADLPRQPRLALRATSDHHRVRPRTIECVPRIGKRGDVAIDHQRNIDRLANGANRVPVGLALVELAAGAAMHRNQPDAGGFGPPRQFRRIDRAVIPTETHLQRHGYADRADGRLDQRQRVVEIAHQGRAGLPPGHMAGGTTHVDVDDVRPRRFGDTGPLRHPAGLAARQLHDMGAAAGGLRAQQRHWPAAHQIVAGRHLGNHQTGAEPLDLPPERDVGDPGHRRQHDPVGDFDGADPQAAGVSWFGYLHKQLDNLIAGPARKHKY